MERTDIAAEGENLTLARLEALHSAKTGALIEASLMIGAYCAEVEPDDQRLPLLRTFGQRIGLAFQIVDDILDVTDSSHTLGKPGGSDDALNKNTFAKLMGLEGAQQRDRAVPVWPRFLAWFFEWYDQATLPLFGYDTMFETAVVQVENESEERI